ncbi:peripheral-type benzodiazepine receptor-associated protein 1-like [Convolutriloba macropyga]|uniref:peripheral-type benzodiazepine receptor-associated protein 1-like n=1 Tax=Convolutriloba macropyga TaxID=536237 RepID=UPI003F51E25D
MSNPFHMILVRNGKHLFIVYLFVCCQASSAFSSVSVKYNDLLHEFNRLKSVVGESAAGVGTAPGAGLGAVGTAGGSPGNNVAGVNNLKNASGATIGGLTSGDHGHLLTNNSLGNLGSLGGNAGLQTSHGGPDIPTEPIPVTVYIAKYTYDPLKFSPNDNPELELCVTKGDYVYIHGDMDEDGFYEGELLGGQRGLVPSNFVDPVKEKELPELLKSHLQKLRNRSLSNLHLNQIAAGNYGLNPKVDSEVQVLEDDISEFPNRSLTFGGVMNRDPASHKLANHNSASWNDQSHITNHVLSNPKNLPSVQNSLFNRSPTHYNPTNPNDTQSLANHIAELPGDNNSQKYSPSYAGSSPRSVSSVGTNEESHKSLTNGPSSRHVSPRNESSTAHLSEDVSPPQKMIVEKMLLNSVLISWSPSSEPIKRVDAYEVFVDGMRQMGVKPYAKLRALLHNIDTQVPHKVSIRTLTTRGLSSRDQQCTIVVGKGAKRSAYDLKAINIQPTSAELVWWPSNSNFSHGLTLNQSAEVRIPVGTWRYTLTGLTPGSVNKVALKSIFDDVTITTSSNSNSAGVTSQGDSPTGSNVAKIEFKTLPSGGKANNDERGLYLLSLSQQKATAHFTLNRTD